MLQFCFQSSNFFKEIHMSLRQNLNTLLPEILPSDPRDAIKGTELISMVQLKLEENYSDASLRYHFSIMSCDPTSPIAKVEKGQGYYLRRSQVPALSSAQELLSLRQGQLDVLGSDLEASNHQIARLEKFHAIVQKYSERLGLVPFVFREALQTGAPLGNLWRFPELAQVEWDLHSADDGELVLDPDSVSIRLSQGLPPYILRAVRLRTFSSVDTFREDFFQALSSSMWAQSGHLYYACSIEDEALLDSIRNLSSHYGIGVTTFGLSLEDLDDLPSTAHLLNANPRETEALMERLQVNVISNATQRDQIDWKSLSLVRGDSTEMDQLFRWIERCLSARKVVKI